MDYTEAKKHQEKINNIFYTFHNLNVIQLKPIFNRIKDTNDEIIENTSYTIVIDHGGLMMMHFTALNNYCTNNNLSYKAERGNYSGSVKITIY